MFHRKKRGSVMRCSAPPQGHGMTVDSKGFIYLGNVVGGMGNVRKYDPKTGALVAELPRAPEMPPGGGRGDAAPDNPRVPGHGSNAPVAGFLPRGRPKPHP